MRLPHFPHPSTYRTDCPIGNRRRHLRTLLPTLPFPPPPAAPLFLAPPAALSICRYTTQDTRYKIQDIWPMGQFLWQGKLIPAFVHALRLIAWPGYKLKHTRTDTYPTHSHTHTSHARTHTHSRTQLQIVATHRLASSSLIIAARCTSQWEERVMVKRGAGGEREGGRGR